MIRVFHHDDLDGYGAAAVIKYLLLPKLGYDSDVEYIELNYNHATDKEKLAIVQPEDEVYILDYSFGEDMYDSFIKLYNTVTNKRIVWIDHHKTSVEFKKNHSTEVDNISNLIVEGTSGAALTYMWVMNDTQESLHSAFLESNLPMFLRYISDYDCWNKKYIESDYFKLGMDVSDYRNLYSTVWMNLFDSDSTNLSKDNLVERIVYLGKVVKKYLDNDYAFVRRSIGYESELNGTKCFCVNSPGTSWVFGDLISKYPMCVLYEHDGDEYAVSLYSEGEVDCSAIAAAYGGGGHPGASGFRCKELPFKKIK